MERWELGLGIRGGGGTRCLAQPRESITLVQGGAWNSAFITQNSIILYESQGEMSSHSGSVEIHILRKTASHF